MLCAPGSGGGTRPARRGSWIDAPKDKEAPKAKAKDAGKGPVTLVAISGRTILFR